MTSTRMIERTLENDPDFKDLRLAESLNILGGLPDLLTALGCNTHIELIRLDRGFLPSLQPDESAAVFAAMGQLPKLQEALFRHGAIPVTSLTPFLLTARNLQKLFLGCMRLLGDPDDFISLEQALHCHSTLETFELCDFSLDNNAVSINGIIKSLAQLPRLERVKIEVTHSRRFSWVASSNSSNSNNNNNNSQQVTLHGSALAQLCRSPTLVELHLSRLSLSVRDVGQLADALAAAAAAAATTTDNNDSSGSSSSSSSSSRLKSLALPHCGITDESGSPLALAIGASTTLQTIDLSCNKLSDEGCLFLATALRNSNNQSVQSLRLWGNVKITNCGFDAARAELVSAAAAHNKKNKACVLEQVPLMAAAAEVAVASSSRSRSSHSSNSGSGGGGGLLLLGQQLQPLDDKSKDDGQRGGTQNRDHNNDNNNKKRTTLSNKAA